MTPKSENSADGIMVTVRQHWDLDGKLPVPVGLWLQCPVCRSVNVLLREWRIGRRNQPRGAERRRLPFRCDVSFKCLECSAVWPHGIPLDEQTGRRLQPGRGVRVVHWREAGYRLVGSVPPKDPLGPDREHVFAHHYFDETEAEACQEDPDCALKGGPAW